MVVVWMGNFHYENTEKKHKVTTRVDRDELNLPTISKIDVNEVKNTLCSENWNRQSPEVSLLSRVDRKIGEKNLCKPVNFSWTITPTDYNRFPMKKKLKPKNIHHPLSLVSAGQLIFPKPHEFLFVQMTTISYTLFSLHPTH